VNGPTFRLENTENIFAATLKEKVRHFTIYTDENNMPHDNGAQAAVICVDIKMKHVEHHLHGRLHNWYGPALVHGSKVEYWLYGVRFRADFHSELVKSLFTHAADGVFDLWYSHPNYDGIQFIEFLVNIPQMQRKIEQAPQRLSLPPSEAAEAAEADEPLRLPASTTVVSQQLVIL